MRAVHIFRGPLSLILTAALVFSFGAVPVHANEDTETTVPLVTQPAETQAAETLPAETTYPAPETAPLEPAETVPETPAPTLATIAYARSCPEGTDALCVRGTVVHAADGVTVLQDNTGGIVLSFEDNLTAVPGLVLQVTGQRSADGLIVKSWSVEGSAALTAVETTLDFLPECTRVLLRNVTYSDGSLIQNGKTIHMTPASPEGISRGDTVDAWGVAVDGWFYADTVTAVKAQTPQGAVITATPMDGVLAPGESIGLYCSDADAVISYSLSYDGVFYTDFVPYSGGIPVRADTDAVYVRACIQGAEDAWTEFYFELPAAEPEEPSREPSGWNLYFGQLHAHTDLSDGDGSVEEAFRYASNVEGLDFFAVTEHSNSFDNADAGAILSDGTAISRKWATGKAAAAAVTDGNFVGIFGYEMTWQDGRMLGHINTFNTPGWQSCNQEVFTTLESYYKALTTASGSVSQFNHPGTTYGYFENFSHYNPEYDERIQLLEVGSENGYTAYSFYNRALEKGWHVAPTNNQANHAGRWGDASAVRTVVLAKTLTEQSLYDAMRSRRVYATEDSDLEIRYYVDGSIMGSILNTPAQEITVSLYDPTDAAIGLVEVIAGVDDNGDVESKCIAQRTVNSARKTLTIPVSGDYRYYYLRITQPDGDIAVTAPVWVDMNVDVGIGSFTAGKPNPAPGEEIALTLEVYNYEREDFLLESVEFFANGQRLEDAVFPESISALSTYVCHYPLRYDGLGAVELRAVVTGSICGATRSYETSLSLRYQTDTSSVLLSDIAAARAGTAGQIFRVKGYVTIGTSGGNSAFPNTIFLQDDTGGIGVVSVTDSIQVGTPLEVVGYWAEQEGNPVLELIDSTVLEETWYRYAPETSSNKAAMDYDTYGGQLLQIEGVVVAMTPTADKQGVSRFTLRDGSGSLATVRVDVANTLASQVKPGSTVRVIGILYKESSGTVVLRVRNCEEVVYVPPRADPTNPKTDGANVLTRLQRTGIELYLLLAVMSVTWMGLAALFRLRKR